MKMKGGGSPIDRAALAPHIEHPTREFIVEALCWIGPLSVPDLKAVLEDPELNLAYHVRAVAEEEVLTEIGHRPAGASLETLYCLSLGK